MAFTNAENQKRFRERIKIRASMPLYLGDDLDDGKLVEHENMTPLEYMISVLNDPNVTPDRRDRMAIAAAPYLHEKADSTQKTKKDEKEAAADEAANGKYSITEPPRLVA